MRKEAGPYRTIVLIDGFNLYYGLKSVSGRQHLWLDLEGLAQQLLTEKQSLATAIYFTAMVRNQTEALKRQDLYLEALRASSGKLQIVRGRFQQRNDKCRQCHHERRVYEEKKTDVSLAVALVEAAAGGQIDTAVLVSGDSDFVPAVHAAKRLRPSLRVVVAFPPSRGSEELKRAADKCINISMAAVRQCQLPPTLEGPNGQLIRPAYWS